MTSWQERLDQCPAMRPWLERAARHAVAREILPASLTLGEIPRDKAVRQALDALFGGCREEQGRLKAKLSGSLRERARWLPLAELLGLMPDIPAPAATPEMRFAQTLQRLKILYPSEQALIERLRLSEPLRRAFRTPAAADDLLALFEALTTLRTVPSGITLSELGARCFNDSKALRNGPRRQQLEHLLRIHVDDPDGDARDLFSACGIVENAYTTHVVVLAPFAYQTRDGAWLDWPFTLWQRGEAAILPWESVQAMTAIRLDAPCPSLFASENAAPFARLVELHRPAVYTEGYPNAAVTTLLRRFAQAGTMCQHWGDTDLDGYRIAEQVARAIPTQLYTPPTSDHHRRAHLRPLTPEQRRRLEQFIPAHPDFPYGAGLLQTLADGWLEQEQTMACLAIDGQEN